MSRPYHPDETADAREAGSSYAEPANSIERMTSTLRSERATKVSPGEGAMNDLHRGLNVLRDEASALAEKLNAVLAPPGPPVPVNGAAASSAPRGEVLASLESAADKVAQIRATLSGISDRYQF